MKVSIKELKSLIKEMYSQNHHEKIRVYIEWYEDDEKDLEALPSKVMVPVYLIEKLKQTQSMGAYQEIEVFILKKVFGDKWNDPSWVRKFSWDFAPEEGLMLNGLEIIELDEGNY